MMIHFSLSPEDTKLVMRALSLWATVEARVNRKYRKDTQLKRVVKAVSVAQKSATHARNCTTTQRIEEITTREGIELCPVIS